MMATSPPPVPPRATTPLLTIVAHTAKPSVLHFMAHQKAASHLFFLRAAFTLTLLQIKLKVLIVPLTENYNMRSNE